MRQKERLRSRFRFRLRKIFSWQKLNMPRAQPFWSCARCSKTKSNDRKARARLRLGTLERLNLASTLRSFKVTASHMSSDKSARRTPHASISIPTILQSQLSTTSKVYDSPTLLDSYVRIFRQRLLHSNSSMSESTSSSTRRCLTVVARGHASDPIFHSSKIRSSPTSSLPVQINKL
jgi:hypothetical protein